MSHLALLLIIQIPFCFNAKNLKYALIDDCCWVVIVVESSNNLAGGHQVKINKPLSSLDYTNQSKIGGA